MIDSWAEIDARFNAIKEHRPKAPKKLNELSELLASAYRLDPEKASEMWDYLVKLNANESDKDAKFYVAQLFSRLGDYLESDELADLLMRGPERVRILVLKGYESGENLWSCLSRLTDGCLRMESPEICLYLVDLLEEKFDHDERGNRSFFLAGKAIIDATCGPSVPFLAFVSSSNEITQALSSVSRAHVGDYARVVRVVEGLEPVSPDRIYDLFALVIEGKMWDRLFPLLKTCRDHLPAERFALVWKEYLAQVTSEDSLPIPSFADDGDQYEGSMLECVLNASKAEDAIIDWYFPSNALFARRLFYCWIGEGDWGRVARYVAKAVNWVKPSRRRLSPWSWRAELGWLLDAIERREEGLVAAGSPIIYPACASSLLAALEAAEKLSLGGEGHGEYKAWLDDRLKAPGLCEIGSSTCKRP